MVPSFYGLTVGGTYTTGSQVATFYAQQYGDFGKTYLRRWPWWWRRWLALDNENFADEKAPPRLFLLSVNRKSAIFAMTSLKRKQTMKKVFARATYKRYLRK